MTPGSQFPDLTPTNLGERYIDPALLDRPIGDIEPQPAPRWSTIAAAAVAALAVIVLTWNGSLFG